jgi:threonyl-tRNA synthetase
VLPVSSAQDDAARSLLDDLVSAGVRARMDASGSLGARIRASRVRRDCVVAVLGAAEVAAGKVQVTDVAAEFRGEVDRSSLPQALARAYAARSRSVDWER